MGKYVVLENNYWTGRVDSTTDESQFRFHQVIKMLDVEKETSKKSGICFIGFACDLGVALNKGRVGAVDGPAHIRKYLMSLPYNFTRDIDLYDAGDVIAESSLSDARSKLSEVIKKVRSLGLIPIVLGGGHEITYASYQGIENKNNLGIINFDAHFDNRPHDVVRSSGTSFSEIFEFATENNYDYNVMALGIQKYGNTKHLFNRADSMGIKYIYAKEFNKGHYDEAIKFVNKVEDVYVTYCVDVFKASMAPGVSAPIPMGLDPVVALEFMKEIIETGKVSIIDFAEVNPSLDSEGFTGRLVATMIFEIIEMISKVE